MTISIDLLPTQEAQLTELASRIGISTDEYARQLVADHIASRTETCDALTRGERLTDEELDARLRAAGVRFGDREKSITLLESLNERDMDPESTVEEWEQIHRNIEQGRLELHRLEF